MNLAWQRLLARLMEGEGAGTGGGTGTGSNGSVPPPNVSDDEWDDDDPDNGPPQDVAKQLRGWRAYAKRLREENTRRRAANARLMAENEQLKSDSEKAKTDHAKALADAKKQAKAEADAEIEKLRKEGETARVNGELKALAQKEGAIDVEDVLRLVDASAIKISEGGEIEGADKLIGDLKKSKPHLFGKASSSTTSTSEKPPETTEVKRAKDMTPEEYAAKRAAFTGVPLPRRKT